MTQEKERFPASLHICTYDVRGTDPETGLVKPVRETGLVAHTHHLLSGLVRRFPDIRLDVTRSGGGPPGQAARLRIPEGLVVGLREVATHFPHLLREPGSVVKSEARVRHFYEDTVGDSANPVWASLAAQYASAVYAAGFRDVLAQNINPLVSLLKAEEFGLLSDAGTWRITGVLHDAAEMADRFGYLAQRITHTDMRLDLIAVSDAVRAALVAAGVPGPAVRTIPNGMDAEVFDARLREAAAGDVFARVASRNGIPARRRVVLVSARRVPWKGHEDVVRAARLLADRDQLGDVAVVFNGAAMLDSRAPGYGDHLAQLIEELGLSGSVFLLDELTPAEVASCYVAADVAVLASTEPEPWGYANLEAMLANVPVVATAHGGPLSYIEDGVSGFLVPPRDPAAIAAVLEQLLTDRKLHASVAPAGRRSALRFTLDAMVGAYADVLARSAAAHPSAARSERIGAR
ncbi:glycosyltransferase family 4 protein [Cryptosporangium sp. NPDC048952]|uniref:glycosyltransferase family 4 protein n=1 Tax=Cryptosporangium sp. NPDC048952 TaxID=3363961 RepID=UPI003712B7F0